MKKRIYRVSFFFFFESYRGQFFLSLRRENNTYNKSATKCLHSFMVWKTKKNNDQEINSGVGFFFSWREIIPSSAAICEI